MSNYSQYQFTQSNNSDGYRKANGFDVFSGNPLMEQSYTAPPQPSFGQTWSPVWNNSPWPDQNFGMSFPLGPPPNGGFVQTQQNDVPDYNEDDDFYEHEPQKPEPSLSLTAEQQPLNENSLAPQIESIGSGTDVENKIITPVPRNLLNGQSTNQRNSAIKSPTPSHMSKQEVNTRAAELRARLLANKRGGSATPQPSSSADEPAKVKPTINASHVHIENLQSPMKQQPVNASESIHSVTGTPLPQSRLKPAAKPIQASKAPLANTDVDGLINEYRASEAVNSPISSSTPEITASKFQAKPPVSRSSNKVQGNNSTVNVKPSILQAQSPGSSESGEIRSDQDLEAGIDRPNQDGNAKNPNAATHQEGAEAAKPVPTNQQREISRNVQDEPSTSVPPGSQKPSSKARFTPNPDISRSAQQRSKFPPVRGPRSPDIEHPRDGASLPLALNNTQDVGPSEPAIAGNVDGGRILSTNPSSSMRSEPPSRRSSRTEAEARRDRREAERNSNEERARLYKERLAEKRQPPSSTNGPSSGSKSLHSVPSTATSPTQPVEPLAPNESNPKQAEPPEITMTVGDDIGKPEAYVLDKAQLEQIQEMRIDLSLESLRDLSDFLEYHRFYVEPYREGFFARQRRMRALEEEKAALERESILQYDHFNSMRAISTSARGKSEPPTSAQSGETKDVFATPSNNPMPPPLTLPQKTVNNTIAVQGSNGAVQPTSQLPQANGNAMHQGNSPNEELKLKRQRGDESDHGHASKIARVELDSRLEYGNHQNSPKTSRSDDTAFDRRRPSEYRPSNHDYRGRSRSPDERHRSYSPSRRGSEPNYLPKQDGSSRSFSDGRDRRTIPPNLPHKDWYYNPDRDDPDFPPHRSHNNSNGNYRGGYRAGRGGYQGNKPRHGFSGYSMSPAPQGATIKGSASLNLKAGDSRYFMIKSWNAENVEAAQRDCIWATQPKNLDVLTEAFNTCRNVILFFSVNNSRAFQGY
ncbi:MAG: hypothetical protein Q9222_006772, partial [Ikaeria aurantiellina]